MNGQNALIVSIGVFVGFVAGLVASKMTAGSNNNEKVRIRLPSSMGYANKIRKKNISIFEVLAYTRLNFPIIYGSYYLILILWSILYGLYNLYYIILLFDVIAAILFFSRLMKSIQSQTIYHHKQRSEIQFFTNLDQNGIEEKEFQ